MAPAGERKRSDETKDRGPASAPRGFKTTSIISREQQVNRATAQRQPSARTVYHPTHTQLALIAAPTPASRTLPLTRQEGRAAHGSLNPGEGKGLDLTCMPHRGMRWPNSDPPWSVVLGGACSGAVGITPAEEYGAHKVAHFTGVQWDNKRTRRRIYMLLYIICQLSAGLLNSELAKLEGAAAAPLLLARVTTADGHRGSITGIRTFDYQPR